jgi:hypothetical protein
LNLLSPTARGAVEVIDSCIASRQLVVEKRDTLLKPLDDQEVVLVGFVAPFAIQICHGIGSDRIGFRLLLCLADDDAEAGTSALKFVARDYYEWELLRNVSVEARQIRGSLLLAH